VQIVFLDIILNTIKLRKVFGARQIRPLAPAQVVSRETIVNNVLCNLDRFKIFNYLMIDTRDFNCKFNCAGARYALVLHFNTFKLIK